MFSALALSIMITLFICMLYIKISDKASRVFLLCTLFLNSYEVHFSLFPAFAL